MQVQVNAKVAAESVRDFVQKCGGTAKNTEALELVAKICGFDSYRAMLAVSQRDSTPRPANEPLPSSTLLETPGRVAFRRSMIDWELDENPGAGMEFIPERRRGRFEVVVEDHAPQVWVSIRPVGTDRDNYHGKAVLELKLEINDGVPCAHLRNDPTGEMLMTVFGTGAGLLVRRDVAESVTPLEAPGTLYELACRNGAQYLDEGRMWAVKNDTFAARTHTDMLVTAIAADAQLLAHATPEPDMSLQGEEASADLADAENPEWRDLVVHAKFDASVGEMKSWLDVCLVAPDGSSDLADTVAGYTVFGKEPEDRADRQAFVTTLAPVAAYFAAHGQLKYMRELVSELIVRPNALELVEKCEDIIGRAPSIHLACDAIEAILAVMPDGLVLSGDSEDAVSCRHCHRSYSLDDEGIYLGMPCPSKKCPSHLQSNGQ